MAYSSQFKYETRRDFAPASLSGTYQKIGSALAHPSQIIKIVNDSTQAIDISIDGTNDHDYVPAGGFWLYDNTTNSPLENNPTFRAAGTQYWVKSTSGSAGTGLIVLVTQYVSQV